MQGKILGAGTISAEDGNRYKFEETDIQNLDDITIEQITGLSVDFIIEDSKAKEVFILNNEPVSKATTTTTSNIVVSDELKDIKTKVFIGMGLRIFGFIPMIGWLLRIAGFIVHLLAIMSLQNMTKSTTLVKNFAIGLGISLVTMFINLFFMSGVLMDSMYRIINGYQPRLDNIAFPLIVIFILGMVSLLFWHPYYKELEAISGRKTFMYVFYCMAVGALIPIVGGFFMIIALFLEIYAWVEMKEVQK